MNTNDYVFFGRCLVDGFLGLIGLALAGGLAWAVHEAVKDPQDCFGIKGGGNNMQLKLSSPMIYTAPKQHKKRTPTGQPKFAPELLAQANIFQFNSTANGVLLQSPGGLPYVQRR